jgi:hypothetical protein
MKPDKLHPHLELYMALMEQLKQRLQVVDSTMTMVGQGMHYAGTGPAIEFALLQLRISCELIALGCVAIHSDIPQTAKLQKMWHAGEIIAAFEKLKEEYFPIAIEDIHFPGRPSQIVHKSDDVLTKEKLLQMYNFFGAKLHAGSFKDHVRPNKRLYSTAILNDFVRQMKKLLNTHVFQLYEKNRLIRIIMQDPTGRVACNIFAAIGKMEDDEVPLFPKGNEPR